MGIRLDWELESEAGWSEIGEDPSAVDARRRRSRQVRNLAIVLLVVGLIAAGFIGWRLRTAARQLQENLRVTIAAETTALRIGDLDGYLRAQADLGSWQRLQRATFDDYQAYGERIPVTGEIVSLDITANRARVVLKEVLDGETYHVQWFYEHTGGDWRHIPPNPEFWGEVVTESTRHFEFQYRDADQALAEALKQRTAAWWDTACGLTACLNYQPLDVTIRIEPDPLMELDWAPYDNHTLLIPSPQLGRITPDGSIDPALFDRVAAALAKYWAYHAVAARMEDVNPGPTPDIAWFRDELADLLAYRFTESGSPPEFLGPLSETYGDEVVIRVLVDLPTAASDNSIVPVVEAAAGESALALPVSWNGYLTQRLRGESAMIADGYETEAQLIYRDSRGGQLASADVPTETMAETTSLTIVSTRIVGGDLLWAEVLFTPTWSGGERSRQAISFEPFRLVDGRLVHSGVAATDWGASQHDETGAYVGLTFFDLDAPNVAGLVPALDEVTSQVMADFGLDPLEVGPIQVFIGPEDPSDLADPLSIWAPSPYASMRSADTSAPDVLYEIAAAQIIERLLLRQLGTFPPNHPFAVAFLTRQAEVAGLDPARVQASYLERYRRVGSAWPAGGGDGWLVFDTPYLDSDYQEARLLLDVLEERFGPLVIPVLLNKLPISTDVDDWLQRSVGITLQDVEADWQNAARD